MTLPESPDDFAIRQTELAALIQRFSPIDGIHETAIAGLGVACATQPSLPMPTLYRPCLCVIAQGRKDIRLGAEQYIYDPLNYLVASVTLPVTGQVIEATPQQPYLSMRLDIDPTLIGNLLAEAGPIGEPNPGANCALFVDRLDLPMLDALIRLLRLLDTPRDTDMLAPLALREIFYRLLRSPQGHRLRELAMADSQSHRIARAIEWINNHFDQALRIEELAREVSLSPSTLHHRFKAVTAMSPLQYQKQLRLQEARRLMLCEGLEAASASFRVGYESPSQFSREYSRLFGAPPLRDLNRLRNAG
ncbi:AraC family transcriptional regulator [Phytopseudomonas dryadis]|uniref:AraC family transcriptional regulator CmrA n=1 Tax=Phytopseudomonas dryadis TaxID=2487520 RepID=A0A4Q9QRL8_9GAMM|nr:MULTISPECIES: AraC family transcriptional regulator [Pseudomonas]TBU83525.1 AraC family transcriptional regulator CmrA [Pseudomonas dryadis]TBV01504.1 AraC family transcriptional regulator CmrA [Pseudomonas dryadis]TBV19423.1 AraC family transcriptional regulator CmrA [Pseudomonas sp. FRB 230]